MEKHSSGSWLVVAAIGVFGVAAVLAYNLVAPTWGQAETSTLLAGLVGCPTVGAVIGLVFLGLHWRDERQAARREKTTAKRQRTIDGQTQDAQAFNANAFVLRQTLDLLGQVAQVQARQAGASLATMRTEAFQQRGLSAPAQDESWFSGEWDYGSEAQADDETSSGIRYL